MNQVQKKCFRIWDVLRNRDSGDRYPKLSVFLLYFYEIGILEGFLKQENFTSLTFFLENEYLNLSQKKLPSDYQSLKEPSSRKLFLEIVKIFFQESVEKRKYNSTDRQYIEDVYKIFNESPINNLEFLNVFLDFEFGAMPSRDNDIDYITDEVAEIMVFMSESTGDDVLYNPFSGYNKIALKIQNYKRLITQEELPLRYSIGLIFSYFYDKNPFEKRSSFISFATSPLKDIKIDEVDCVIAQPPFGLRDHVTKDNKVIPKLLMNYADLIKADKLKRVIILLEPNASWGRHFYHVRKEIIDYNLLDYVIELPSNALPFVGFGSTIWTLKKNSNVVKYIKAPLKNGVGLKSRTLRKSKILDIESIKKIVNKNKHINKYIIKKSDLIQEDYILHIGSYMQKELSGEPLSKYLTEVNSINLKALPSIPSKLNIIDSNSITSGFVDQTKIQTVNELNKDSLNQFGNEGFRFFSKSLLESQNSQLILIPVSNSPKNEAAILELDDKLYAISTSFKVFINTNDQILDEFILHELSKSSIREQRELLRKARLIYSKDILRLKIQVIALDEQRRLLDELRIRKGELLKLSEIYDRKFEKNEIDRQGTLGTIAHILNTPLGSLRISLKTIDNFIEKYKSDFLVLDNKFKERYKDSLRDRLESSLRQLDYIYNVINTPEINLNSFPLKKVTLKKVDEYFKNLLISNYSFKISYESQLNYDIEEEQDETNDERVEINMDLLKMLTDALLKNAEKHAFDSSIQNPEVRFSLIDEDDRIQLKYLDNGKGFPNNFGKNQFSEKFKTSNKLIGTGEGGYTINRIAEYFYDGWDFIEHKNIDISVEFNFYMRKS